MIVAVATGKQLSLSDFIATYDGSDPTDRWFAARLLERVHGELYRRERELHPEWIDMGGEG